MDQGGNGMGAAGFYFQESCLTPCFCPRAFRLRQIRKGIAYAKAGGAGEEVLGNSSIIKMHQMKLADSVYWEDPRPVPSPL